MSVLEESTAAPATLDLHHTEEPEQSHTDKRFLFSESGGQREVWVVRGRQIPKLTVLIVSCAGLALLSLILAIWCGQLQSQQGQDLATQCAATGRSERYECETTGCLRQAAEISSYINRTVSPCQDFFQYACGRFDDVHPLGTQISYSVQNMLENVNKLRIEAMLEKGSFHDDRSAVSKAKTFFRTCMASFYNSTNTEQVRDLINILGGVDLLGTFDSSGWDFVNIFYHTREVHRLRLFFSITWMQTMELVVIALPQLGLRNTSVYTDQSEGAVGFKNIYKQGIVSILQMLEQGVTNRSALNRTCGTSCAEAMADDVIRIETEIAKSMPGPSLRHQFPRKPDANLITLDELDRISPEFRWRQLLARLFGAGAIPPDTNFRVPSKDYMISVDKLVKSTNSSAINNYIKWNLLKWYLPSMGPIFASLSAQMDYITKGKEMKTRQETCYDLLRLYFPRAVRALFIQKHIGQDNLASAKRMVERIKKHLSPAFDWMSEPARHSSQQYLDNLIVGYGHSAWVTDPQKLNQYYKEVSMSTKNFFANLVNAGQFKASELKADVQRLGNDDDSDDDVWIEGETKDVKIVYNHARSVLTIPVGGLQVPLFSHENPDYINAATFGSLVLRQLASPFYLRHRARRQPNWWDAATTDTFNRYSACLMESMDNYTVLVERGFHFQTPATSGIHVRSTIRLEPRKSYEYLLSEHLAFLLSYNLFKAIMEEDGPQPVLPGTQGQTPEQLFFLAFAQSRCRHTNPQLKVLINSAFREFPHPEMINNFMYNSPEFMEAYKCQTIPSAHVGKTCTLP